VPSNPVSGRLYVTNWRLLWEATAASASDEELPAASRASVSIPFYSIDRFVKYTKQSSSTIQPGDTDIFAEVFLKYGAVPALRVLAGAAAFGRLSAIIHDARGPGFDQIFATLHAAAVATSSGDSGAARRPAEAKADDPLCAAANTGAPPFLRRCTKHRTLLTRTTQEGGEDTHADRTHRSRCTGEARAARRPAETKADDPLFAAANAGALITHSP
jgi:hypothetical protein